MFFWFGTRPVPHSLAGRGSSLGLGPGVHFLVPDAVARAKKIRACLSFVRDAPGPSLTCWPGGRLWAFVQGRVAAQPQKTTPGAFFFFFFSLSSGRARSSSATILLMSLLASSSPGDAGGCPGVARVGVCAPREPCLDVDTAPASPSPDTGRGGDSGLLL